MSLVLDSARLEKSLALVRDHPDDPSTTESLLELLKPIIKLTVERFPSHLSEDIGQEIKIFIMKKMGYIAKAWQDGKIANPTGYFFRVCYNAATNYIKKELKHESHLMPIDDIKIEPAIMPKTDKKQRLLDAIQQDVLSFIRVRFTKPKDTARAERFVTVILDGKRPSFQTDCVQKFSAMRYKAAKSVYSIVLKKIRELVLMHIDEFLN